MRMILDPPDIQSAVQEYLARRNIPVSLEQIKVHAEYSGSSKYRIWIDVNEPKLQTHTEGPYR